MILIMLSTAFLCLLSTINAYKAGAPATVCNSMMPKHGAAAQTDFAPYIILILPILYSSGTTHTVTLVTTGSSFKGYLLTMRRVDNHTIIVPGFSAPNGAQLLTCDNQTNAAVTHTDNSSKTSVMFTWTAPAQSVGDLQVVATVVQNKKTFWTNIESHRIVVFGSSTTTAGCVLGILGSVAITMLIL